MKLKPGSHIYLMGICGTAMASLAGLFKEQGFEVSGSDENVYPPMSTQLEALNIPVHLGYRAENLKPKPDLVIVGNVIRRDNPEAQMVLNSDIPYTSLPKAMGEWVIADRHSVVVAGTHGKTTTTSMLATIADQCQLKAGFLIGGIPANFGRSFHAPEGDWFIIEGDEYDTAFFDKVPKFIHYKPRSVIFTSLEFDHVDIYKNLDEVKSAFRELIKRIPQDGLLVANIEDQNVKELIKEANCRVVTYGLESGDYQAIDREMRVGRNQFTVIHKDNRLADIAMKQFGAHNTLNALGAFALANELKWDLRGTLQGLANFKGVKRRQEIIGEPNGITVIEDFAHHPTAVKLTLESMQERYPDRRVFAVFEPRSATSRRKVFQKDYVEAFKGPAKVIIAKPFNQGRIPEEERFSSESLISELQAAGTEAELGDSADAIVARLKDEAQTGDVILIMSNGGFDGIYGKLLNALNSR